MLNTFQQQCFIHFGLVWHEMQSSLPTETDARRNHSGLGELCSLSYQPTFINVGVKAGGGNFEHTYAKMNYLSDFGICNNSQCFLTMKINQSINQS